MKNLLFLTLITFLISCTSAPNPEIQAKGCKFDPAWLVPHEIPTEINNGKDASDCDIYQYVVENFVAVTYWYDQPRFLGAMSVAGVFNDLSLVRVRPTAWGETQNYNLETCILGKEIPNVVSDLTNQAGEPRPLIDIKGNYTFYDVRMNHTLYDFILECRLTPDNRCRNRKMDERRFPPGSHEMKIAWMILDGQDPENYITSKGWVKNPDTGKCSSELLGMVGFHLVMATDHHPEMIWSSWTHKDNNPLCSERVRELRKYSYYSKDSSIPINTYVEGVPSNICNPSRAQGPVDKKVLLIEQLKRGYARAMRGTVGGNYEMLGAIWTKDGAMPSRTDEQRGALALAHPEMESYYQGELNCFSCHTYSRPDDAIKVSHINDVTRNKRRDQGE